MKSLKVRETASLLDTGKVMISDKIVKNDILFSWKILNPYFPEIKVYEIIPHRFNHDLFQNYHFMEVH